MVNLNNKMLSFEMKVYKERDFLWVNLEKNFDL